CTSGKTNKITPTHEFNSRSISQGKASRPPFLTKVARGLPAHQSETMKRDARRYKPPGTKSPTGATFGNASERDAVVTASARNLACLPCLPTRMTHRHLVLGQLAC